MDQLINQLIFYIVLLGTRGPPKRQTKVSKRQQKNQRLKSINFKTLTLTLFKFERSTLFPLAKHVTIKHTKTGILKYLYKQEEFQFAFRLLRTTFYLKIT